MNIFTLLWKRFLFKKHFWQEEELEVARRKGEEIYNKFHKEINDQKDLNPEIGRLVNGNFWDLI
jgi:hypothetical protein